MKKHRLVPVNDDEARLRAIQNELVTRQAPLAQTFSYGPAPKPPLQAEEQRLNTLLKEIISKPVNQTIATQTGELPKYVDLHSEPSVLNLMDSQPAIATQTETPTQTEATQTKPLYDTLVTRYINHVETAITLLQSSGFRFNITEMKMRNPPDVDLIPVIETLAARLLVSEDERVKYVERQIFHPKKISPRRLRKRPTIVSTPHKPAEGWDDPFTEDETIFYNEDFSSSNEAAAPVTSTPSTSAEGRRLRTRGRQYDERVLQDFDATTLRRPFEEED